MSGGGGGDARQLDLTPTWAVAAVCAIIVIISILLEKIIHKFAKMFEEKKKHALLEALEKIKAELMILGFISLLLTFGQNYISKVCIPERFSYTMLPCLPVEKRGGGHGEHGAAPHEEEGGEAEAEEHHRRLLSYERRFLSAEAGGHSCELGHVPLISVNGLHQLHIFIFFLAVFHVIYSAITMTLGRAKIRGWKAWEQDHIVDQDALNDPRRFRLTHETSFVRDHNSFWTKTPVTFYFVCFFRQFFRSVRRADYLTMRHGFVTVHLAPGSKFDFQKYIKRSLEDDFKVVVGISPILWASVVLFLLVNVHGWHASFWVSFLPLLVILAVGTKLQAIITRMALDIKERHAVVQGIPLVQVSDKYFWFAWPQLVLYLIHYVLFQNAFELTYFWWTWYEFGWASCFYEDDSLMIVRVALGIGAQVVCSYVTLPLYALVTQMGSTMKKSIFDDQTSRALKQWHKNALKKKASKGRAETRTLGASPGESPDVSPRPTTAEETEMAEHGATIVSTVDNEQQQYNNRDLLTGP
ncbi:MLO-like protein 9 [Cajanus cajan]|uniref:MLO-like protein n=1 Tax=Cajanus cajan TaxID=3821 RepID=A0A151TCT8_CAJCA|nr:MLO-like protein 9 [Cajanus cajan]KYP64880.1 MLO-like protein 5 [Cajanus cajan]